MKSLKSLIVCGLLALTSSAFAQTFTMTFPDVTIEKGNSASMTITFKSEVTPTGWQMYLYLPEGITLDEDEYELFNSNRKHDIDFTEAGDGAMMLIMSAGTKTFEMEASEGDLCSLTLKADDTFTGSATATVKKIAIADVNGTQYNLGSDVTFNITEAGATGINSLNAEDSNEPAFNLAGQKVSNNYKGIVVKNGKKAIVK